MSPSSRVPLVLQYPFDHVLIPLGSMLMVAHTLLGHLVSDLVIGTAQQVVGEDIPYRLCFLWVTGDSAILNLVASMGIGLGSPLRSELSYSIRILRAIASTVSKRIRGTDTVGPPYRGRFFICSMNACHSSSVAFTSLETRSAARTISFCMIYSGRSAEILFRDFAAKSSSLS